MPPSSNKKVIVERFDRETIAGFVQTSEGFATGPFEVLRPEGNVALIPRTEAKAICFVRDFESPELWRGHRKFQARPKIEGLWLRLRFRDGDTIEGLATNNLRGLESGGFMIVPPDGAFHNQRMFVPSEALEAVEVLGVIGTPLRRKLRPVSDPDTGKQIELFS